MSELRSLLKTRGATVETTGSGHYLAEYDGHRWILPATPSDHRSLANAIKGAERALGLDLRRIPSPR